MKINNKKINYVKAALKEDVKNNPKRPLNELMELVRLIKDQYDDKINFTIKGNQYVR